VSQRWTRGKTWRIDTRWGQATIHGGCERCGTSWRYVDPYPIPVNPYGRMAIMFPFCRGCHTGTPVLERERLYLEWWVMRRERIAEEGLVVPPDIREWQEIRTALGVEANPQRLLPQT
jgi:hypothetical protein